MAIYLYNKLDSGIKTIKIYVLFNIREIYMKGDIGQN